MRGLGASGDEDQPPAVPVAALPGLLDLGQRHLLDRDLECPAAASSTSFPNACARTAGGAKPPDPVRVTAELRSASAGSEMTGEARSRRPV
ncbi:MAG: hypothetical protein ABSB76_21275 [Streptosporangiaceae bacterium]